MCWQIGVELSSEATAAGVARDVLRDQVAPLLSLEVRYSILDDAALIVTEMVANAAQAGATRIELDVELHRGQLFVAVIDNAAGWPTPRVGASCVPNGRGLAIIDALSHQWGVTPGVVTKQVWGAIAGRAGWDHQRADLHCLTQDLRVVP
jgi:anti-sigma regulatory factor (Ser/Thr protein kinase)